MISPALSVLPALVLLPLLALAHPTPNQEGTDVEVGRALPGNWFHERGHPVERLFNRQTGNIPTDGIPYATVGSAQWSQGFPDTIPDSSKMPQEWQNALQVAVAAGKIPNIPTASLVNQNPVYPSGSNSSGSEICSATVGCRVAGDLWDAPNGVLALSFDDGPTTGSSMLYDFLGPRKIPATHFMIGSNIKSNPALFQRAFNEIGNDIACHTWSHRYMTTLNNSDVVSELGWTLEIIKNSTGGRIPRFWRPPYGDADNRVRAIASEIFGMQTVIWNQDTDDWELATAVTTPQAINTSMTTWLNGPKTPGLMILEHELDNMTVAAFEAAWPLMSSTGWDIRSVARMNGQSVYLNSQDGISPVQAANGAIYKGGLPVTSTSSSAPPPPTTTGNATGNVGSNTSQSRNGGSIQTTISKLAGAVGAMFLAVVFYA